MSDPADQADTLDRPLAMIGVVEQFLPPRGLTGWVAAATDVGNPPVDLVICLDGREIGRTTADSLRERPDAPGQMVRGFGLHVSIDLTYAQFSHRAVQVCPVIAGRPGPPLAYLSLLEAVAGAGAALQTLAALRAASGHEFDFVMKRLMSSSLLGFPERGPLLPMRTLRGAAGSYHRAIVETPPVGPDCDLTPLLVPVGIQSGDGSAVLGHDGFVFLIGGSNNLSDGYAAATDAPAVQSAADAWHQVFRNRQERLRAAGVRYLQIVLPEKIRPCGRNP